jgi:hypothetical protein
MKRAIGVARLALRAACGDEGEGRLAQQILGHGPHPPGDGPDPFDDRVLATGRITLDPADGDRIVADPRTPLGAARPSSGRAAPDGRGRETRRPRNAIHYPYGKEGSANVALTMDSRTGVRPPRESAFPDPRRRPRRCRSSA